MSPRVVLVRHGKAAAGWGDDLDPGLDPTGRVQAARLAEELGPAGPLPIIVSPLRRTRETAAPLARRWGVDADVETAVGEIPSPSGSESGLEWGPESGSDELAARAAWLREALEGRWSDLGPRYEAWRRRVLDRLCAIEADTVVVTHFVAINVAVGAASGDDRVVVFRPGYCSRTSVEVDGGRLRTVEFGDESATRVL